MERITIHLNTVGDGAALVDEPIEIATLETTIETAKRNFRYHHFGPSGAAGRTVASAKTEG